MKKALFEKFREALLSVLPVTLIVIVLNFTPLISLTGTETAAFSVCALLLIVGISLFNLGADIAMTPIGEHIAEGLTKTKKIGLLLAMAFLMGLTITVAEPDLSVLASQVSAVMNGTVLIVSVGVGVGFFLLIGVIKILKKGDLTSMLMFFYMLMFALSTLLSEKNGSTLMPLAFDSGGVTTGPVTVPFIMAFGTGIAMTIGGRNAGENSFGLISLCSVGPIIAVLALAFASDGGEMQYALADYSVGASLGKNLLPLIRSVSFEVARSLLLVSLFFAVLQITILKLPKRRLLQIAIGIFYTFAGLVIFLVAVTVGFMPVGYKIGSSLASIGEPLLIGFGFVIGAVVVLAEPAVHVLNRQVEDITGGTVTKTEMLVALSVGVGISIGLSLVRIVFGFSLLYYLIPGYLISLGLSFFVPKIYTAIAFDSGGVASGPLTSSFILPLAIGACVALRGEASVLQYAFGVVAMVAMTPLITIQLLGFKAVVRELYRRRVAMRSIMESDDGQIIYF